MRAWYVLIFLYTTVILYYNLMLFGNNLIGLQKTYLWSNQWQSFTKCSHHLCLILVCDWLQPRLTMCGVLLLNSEWWFECWVLLWWGAGREEVDCVLCCVGYFKCLVCELGVPRLIPRVLANRMYIRICPNEFHLLIVAQCNVKWEWDGFFTGETDGMKA